MVPPGARRRPDIPEVEPTGFVVLAIGVVADLVAADFKAIRIIGTRNDSSMAVNKFFT